MVQAEAQTLVEQLDRQKRSVSYDAYDITVRQLVDMVSNSEIEIAPEYQRHFLWDVDRESELVESVYLGIPVPSLFMATDPNGTWEVVDGVQRLSTLLHFVGNEELLKLIKKSSSLKLNGLKKLTELNGKSFNDLPKSIQLAFTLRPLRITTLNDRSDVEVRYDLFERLNTGGVQLHAQEIRNCIFRGEFKEQIKNLATLDDFRNVVQIRSKEQKNAIYEECVLRFFAFIEGYEEFDHYVEQFLTSYARDRDRKGVSSFLVGVFQQTMAFLRSELPEGVVRKGRTPINLFEAVAVGAGLVIQSGRAPKVGVLRDLITDDSLKAVTQGGTNTRAMVRRRIELVRDALS